LNLLQKWAAQLATLPAEQAAGERRRRIEDYLDLGIGAGWLRRPEIAEIVEQALFQFDGVQYDLHAWVVMPNHVHVLISPNLGSSLSQIVHSWKSFTAKKANAVLRRNGTFWQTEYFDRVIRNERHFDASVFYIEHNPVKAGLCGDPKNWPFSSASRR
jgi:REP element-mobilizing transposase RayT